MRSKEIRTLTNQVRRLATKLSKNRARTFNAEEASERLEAEAASLVRDAARSWDLFYTTIYELIDIMDMANENADGDLASSIEDMLLNEIDFDQVVDFSRFVEDKLK